MSKGIDYGLGQTNIDPETGMRYGVISQHSVEHWGEESEPQYGEPACPYCGNAAQDIDHESVPDLDNYKGDEWEDSGRDYACPDCKYTFESEEAYPDEPFAWTYNHDGLEAQQEGDDFDIFVTKSPYFTHAQFCSPCAPGACHLDHPMPNGAKAYCLGHDWFEGDIAPYPVYRVGDGSFVCSPPATT